MSQAARSTSALAALTASTLINRNVTVAGHRTSVRLEAPMWEALTEICRRERKRLPALVTEIEGARRESTLTAAIRVHVMAYFRAAATESGHRRAGHGPLARLEAAA